MSTDQLPPHVMVTRFYTSVRRIPTLVGKLPNGGFIPGGPYTLGQVVLLLLVAIGGFYTMPWWGGGNADLGNFIKLAMAVALTSMLSSKVRWRGRQVLPALRGAAYSYTHGSQPRQGGRTPTARGPQRLRSNILLIEDLPAPVAAPLAQAAVLVDQDHDAFRPNGQPTSKYPRTGQSTPTIAASTSAKSAKSSTSFTMPSLIQDTSPASLMARAKDLLTSTLHTQAAVPPARPTSPARPISPAEPPSISSQPVRAGLGARALRPPRLADGPGTASHGQRATSPRRRNDRDELVDIGGGR
jgi:hypothetical protein